MSIQIGSTVVINDSLELENIDGADGKYDFFSPNIRQTTGLIDFDTPMMECYMTSNLTFTEGNKRRGNSALLLLDTTANQYTPTFSNNIKWSGGTVPNWSNFQHWQIAFVCQNNVTVRATALGYTTLVQPGLQTSFARPPFWRTKKSITASSGFPETYCDIRFIHYPNDNKIVATFGDGDSQTAATTTAVNINYTDLTNITSIQVKYDVTDQGCGGDCNALNYGIGPTPAADGWNSGTYYDIPTTGTGVRQFAWMAQSNPNEFAAGQAATFASFDPLTPDITIRIICDQGTFFSTCSLGGFREIELTAFDGDYIIR